MTREEFIQNISYSEPYTKEDLLKAIDFGRQSVLEEVELLMVGHAINGVCQNVLTEDKYKELLSKSK
jgi:hypothetical protein